MTPSNSSSKFLVFALAAVGLFGLITFALSAATLGTLNKRLNEVNKKLDVSISTDKEFLPIQAKSALAKSVLIDDLMAHLNEFERIGKESENNRAIGTQGFHRTVNYIDEYLKKNAYNFNVFRESFPVTNFSIDGTPHFSWYSNNVEFTLKYSSQLAEADFTPVNYSAAINSTIFQVFIVKNTGCYASDWTGVAEGGIKRAALVIAGGWCTYAEKGEFAANQSAGAILFYNHGLTTSSLAPAIIRLRQKNRLPAIFLSSSAGRRLINAMNETKNNVTVLIDIQLKPFGTFPVENICADTNFGDPNQIILVGSHSDSVPPGPGINDNGSGSAANLVLATNLARLASNHEPIIRYKYRVRFCWWGAEEIGLVGAIHHVDKAVEKNELNKYLVNLNFDMLGSPNFMFGIYDGRTANPLTPAHAINGSIRISEAFRDWFNEHQLPFDYTDFSGRSDYRPFLRHGIVAGGLFSGADDTKSMEQRKQYEQRLGLKQAGLAGAIHDPCYHRLCDNIDNIEPLGFLTMVQVAADMLDYLGNQPNLPDWLYPNGRF